MNEITASRTAICIGSLVAPSKTRPLITVRMTTAACRQPIESAESAPNANTAGNVRVPPAPNACTHEGSE
jgi:hypothetical protein